MTNVEERRRGPGPKCVTARTGVLHLSVQGGVLHNIVSFNSLVSFALKARILTINTTIYSGAELLFE